MGKPTDAASADISEGERSLPVFHACLAGPTLSEDYALIRRLLPAHQVTVVRSALHAMHNALLETVDVLVLECKERPAEVLSLVPELHRRLPALPVMLIDGGITQEQIAAAYCDGARDYFAAPYEVDVLAERIHWISVGRRSPREERHG